MCNTNAPYLLDNGQPGPEKKYFEQWSYNEITRTFNGNINWTPVTYQNFNKFEFVMIFDEDFTTISGGTYKQCKLDGTCTSFMFDVGVDMTYSVHSAQPSIEYPGIV